MTALNVSAAVRPQPVATATRSVTPPWEYVDTLQGQGQEDLSMRVTRLTRDELLERHKQLLSHARMPREELEQRAEAGLLSGDDYWLWEEIRGVEFLLGDVADDGQPASH